MKLKNKYLYWIPRILGIILVVFWFSFIILSHGFSFTSLVESIVWITILITLLMAWNWELIGGILFFVWGLLYFLFALNKFPISAQLIITLPLVILGVLFILDYYFNKKVIS